MENGDNPKTKHIFYLLSGLVLFFFVCDYLLTLGRTTNYCLKFAGEQEKTVMEKWLPELKTAVLNAEKCLEDCKYVRGLVSSSHESYNKSSYHYLYYFFLFFSFESAFC